MARGTLEDYGHAVQLEALAAAAAGGSAEVYAGTMPTKPQGALEGATFLGSCTLPSPAFAIELEAGRLRAEPIESSVGREDGEATFIRVVDPEGRPLFTVSAAGQLHVERGGPLTITELVYRERR